MADVAIRTEHLTKVYGGRVIAVNDLTLEVPVGAVYGLLGPNGAGKTTTIRLLLGLQRPTAGWAEVMGHRCGVQATTVRHAMGYLPTNPSFPGHLRPFEYLDLLGKICRVPGDERRRRAADLLRAVELLGATNQRISTFSTGMRTRLGIAASLLHNPTVLIWDEPTAGLDPAARRFTLDLIADQAGKRTVILATHILSDIDQICDHVGVVHEGRMIFSGSMREVRQRLRRDSFHLELDGPVETIRRLAAQLPAVGGLETDVRDDRVLIVRIPDDCNRAGVMAEVLQRVAASDVSLRSIGAGQSDTESAYLQLLQEDRAYGFRRFDFQTPSVPDADAGDHGS
jgi:ABC-2 type transport system ATP-binding protein